MAPRPGSPAMRGVPLREQRLERVLPAAPRSAELARAATRVACRSWDMAAACDTAALVATELVGNSVRHARTRELVLRLAMTPRRLRVEVADSDPTPPRPRAADGMDEAGRGLLVVSELAARWGVQPEPGGKAVWVEIPLPAQRRGEPDR